MLITMKEQKRLIDIINNSLLNVAIITEHIQNPEEALVIADLITDLQAMLSAINKAAIKEEQKELIF